MKSHSEDSDDYLSMFDNREIHGNSNWYELAAPPATLPLLEQLLKMSTGHYVGVVVAAMVVAIFQFRTPVFGYLAYVKRIGIVLTLADCFFGTCDFVRACYQMSRELVRIGCISGAVGPTVASSNLGARTSSSGMPPPLVVFPIDADPSQEPHVTSGGTTPPPKSPSCHHVTSCTTELTHHSLEIEPAFLNESDYPPGWLVYHPVLGVVSKDEAKNFAD